MGFGSKRGGTKVPNAKLKPVPLAAVSDPAIGSSSNASKVNKAKGKQKQTTPIQPDIEEEDDLDRSLFRESLCREKLILAGHVVCFSGILEPVKSQAKAYAEKLGGTVTKALTLDVTHLICDKPGSDKYRAAIENNIKVMLPMWLEALYSSFIEGDTVDVAKITNRYAMKPFHNLKFAITGSSSTTPRTSFIQLAEDHGAAVSMDLDMDCTHLIVLADDLALFDLDKVQAARKAEPLIKVVWQEWLEDSVARDGCLLESPYLVKDGTPRPGRLCLRPSTSVADGRSEPEQDHSTQDFHVNEPQVTIKRQVTRAGSQTALLASIISAEDLPTRGSSARTEPANMRVPSPDLDQDQADLGLPDVQKKVVVASTPAARAGSQISNFLDQSKGGDRLSLVKKLSSVRSSKFEPHVSQRLEDSASQCDWTAPELFRGYTISIAGCPPNHHRAITQAVTQCGAKVVSDHSQADYTIVPHINPLCIPPGCNPVAHSWVELSLFYRKIVDPDRHWAARPIRLHPITNPEQYSFSACGFNIPEVKVIQRALKAMKMKFIECPRRSEVTHLFIGPEKASARVQKVQSWSEKGLVNFEWLITLARGERVGSRKLTTSDDSLRLPSGTLDHQGQSTPLEVPQPLIDCVIYITKKAYADRNSRSVGACCKLGARVTETFGEEVTHLVHVGERSNDTSREFRQAKSKGLHIVHPFWLTECKRKASRADELAFLHTYKPGLALDYETLLSPSRSQAPIDSSRPLDQRTSHSSPNALLDLQEDEEFFDLKQAAVPDDGALGNSSRNHAPPVRQLNKRHESLPGSSPPVTANIGDEFETTTRQSAINAPTSPHTSENGLISFASLHRSEPGMETQVGGFISFLQQRMITDDSTKEKDSRRGRKRVLADLSRTSSTGARGHPVSPSTDCHQEADVSKNTGLHRTLSDLTRPSPTRRMPFESNDTEESMRVTWDDTTFGGIVEASSKQNGEGRGDRLRVLVDPNDCFGPARIAPPALDQGSLGWRPGNTRPVVIDLESDDDRSGNCVNGPASKRRKPRLMS